MTEATVWDAPGAGMSRSISQSELPFSGEKLDQYLDDAGIDLLLAKGLSSLATPISLPRRFASRDEGLS